MATPNALLAEANCYACETPGEWPLIQLALWRRILLVLDPMADTTPQTLLADSSCFLCYGSSPGLLQVMGLVLLNGISDSISGGSGVQRVFRGSFGDPNGNVTANGDAVYYDTDGSYWVHDSAGNNDTNWVELIAA